MPELRWKLDGFGGCRSHIDYRGGRFLLAEQASDEILMKRKQASWGIKYLAAVWPARWLGRALAVATAFICYSQTSESGAVAGRRRLPWRLRVLGNSHRPTLCQAPLKCRKDSCKSLAGIFLWLRDLRSHEISTGAKCSLQPNFVY